MIIRDAVKSELPLIREQRVSAYSEHAQSIPKDHWNALKQAISSEADSNAEVELIVAEFNNKIIGSVVLFPPNTDAYEGYLDKLNYCEIRMLAVEPDSRGMGVATALISECIERAKLKGYDKIGLHTGEYMVGAINLYNRFGFKRIPEYDFEPANDGIIVKAFQLSI